MYTITSQGSAKNLIQKLKNETSDTKIIISPQYTYFCIRFFADPCAAISILGYLSNVPIIVLCFGEYFLVLLKNLEH